MEVLALHFTRRRYKDGLIRHYLLAGFIAIELLMSFSFLGYFHVEPISITFAYIPVLLAGCILGPASAALIGFVFGLASMWKASASYVLPADQIFSPVLSGNPIGSLLLSLGARVLFGLVMGFLFTGAKRAPRWSHFLIGLVSACGRFIHSFLVYGFMGIFFPEMGFSVGNAFDRLGSLSNVISALLAAMITLGLYALRRSRSIRRFEQRMEEVRHFQTGGIRHFGPMILTTLFTLISTGAIALYFVQRMQYVLNSGGYPLDEVINYDLLHLQVQFLLGILALTFLVVLCLFFVYQNTVYLDYEARMDPLTGVMNRNGFFSFCESALKSLSFTKGETGYFLILDVDYFKKINDLMGHPKGDEILCRVAQCLQDAFGRWGVIGRIGGDEFVAFLHTPLVRSFLETLLKDFVDQIHEIPGVEGAISCSIGVVPFQRASSAQSLYEEADRCLYEAKRQGRDGYYIGETQGAEPDPVEKKISGNH